MNGRNAVHVASDHFGPSHFRLCEFENAEGLAMIHASTLTSLELVRRDLAALTGEEVHVVITDGVRTALDNERLAARLGWTDQGGAVSRRSRHLAQFGGIAVDLIARSARDKRQIPQSIVGEVCRRHFDWVKDDYRDGHVHADNRNAPA